jgi:uncharacterized OB-fold protein
MSASEFPLPQGTAVSEPYWDALAGGELHFQRCTSCGNAWLPPRAECPRCLAATWEWVRASGRGKVVTWVVYHRAYHPAFESRLPYNVAVVELEEGPRLVTNIVDPVAGLGADAPVELAIEDEHGVALARFRLS